MRDGVDLIERERERGVDTFGAIERARVGVAKSEREEDR